MVNGRFSNLELPEPDFVGNRDNGIGASFYWPYVAPEVTVYEAVENPQIPANEISVPAKKIWRLHE
jgi:hypothetical protein